MASTPGSQLTTHAPTRNPQLLWVSVSTICSSMRECSTEAPDHAIRIDRLSQEGCAVGVITIDRWCLELEGGTYLA